MMWRTKFAKRLLLFLDTKSDHTATHKEIKKAFLSEKNVDKIITDTLDKNWIVRLSNTEYKLTKIGEYEILKMTKKLKNEIIVDLKLVKWKHCTSCMARFPTKLGSSWCSNCKRHRSETKSKS